MNQGDACAIQVVPVGAVDTTGAGDMYAAGILHGPTRVWSWPQSGRLGSQVATRPISAMGSRLVKPLSHEEMMEFEYGD